MTSLVIFNVVGYIDSTRVLSTATLVISDVYNMGMGLDCRPHIFHMKEQQTIWPVDGDHGH